MSSQVGINLLRPCLGSSGVGVASRSHKIELLTPLACFAMVPSTDERVPPDAQRQSFTLLDDALLLLCGGQGQGTSNSSSLEMRYNATGVRCTWPTVLFPTPYGPCTVCTCRQQLSTSIVHALQATSRWDVETTRESDLCGMLIHRCIDACICNRTHNCSFINSYRSSRPRERAPGARRYPRANKAQTVAVSVATRSLYCIMAS